MHFEPWRLRRGAAGIDARQESCRRSWRTCGSSWSVKIPKCQGGFSFVGSRISMEPLSRLKFWKFPWWRRFMAAKTSSAMTSQHSLNKSLEKPFGPGARPEGITEIAFFTPSWEKGASRALAWKAGTEGISISSRLRRQYLQGHRPEYAFKIFLGELELFISDNGSSVVEPEDREP